MGSLNLCSECLQRASSPEFQHMLHKGGKALLWDLSLQHCDDQKGKCGICREIRRNWDVQLGHLARLTGANSSKYNSCSQVQKLSVRLSHGTRSGADWFDLTMLSMRVEPTEATLRGQKGFSIETKDNYWIYSDPNDKASQFISGRVVNRNVDCEQGWDTAVSWLSTCVNDHAACRQVKTSSLPPRVIDVQGDPRIFDSNDKKGSYAALSYCWGGKQPLMLTSKNYPAYCKSFNANSQPQTIQDAIKVTRKLGLRYLWIDALCIIQDDKADKRKEIKRMPRIFGDAEITIVASSAATVHDGFLQVRPAEEAEICVQLPYCTDGDVSGEPGTIQLRRETGYPQYDYRQNPTESRAWCFEEKLLPRRRLVFGARDMRWLCDTTEASNGGHVDSKMYPVIDRLPKRLRKDKSASFGHGWKVAADEDEYQPLWDTWKEFLEDYTSRAVTNHEDRLIAVAGLVEHFQEATQDVYLAGLWRSHLSQELLWQRSPYDDDGPEPRPLPYRAPSWSWASVNGHVKCFNYEEDPTPYLTIVSCNVTPLSKDLALGQVIDGKLVLRSRARTAAWFPDDETLYELVQDPWCSNLPLGGWQPKKHHIGKQFGTAWPDAIEPSSSKTCLVLCVSITTCGGLDSTQQGLVLVRIDTGNPQEEVYQRVAIFSIPSREDASDENASHDDASDHSYENMSVDEKSSGECDDHDWFFNASEREIVIV